MGGKALLAIGIQVERIHGRETYEQLCNELVDLLSTFYVHVEPLPQVSWKKSFGDIDMLCSGEKIEFRPDLSVTKGHYTSFLYKTHQVDVIRLEEPYFQFAKMNLFSDMSAILGSFLKEVCWCKYSHDGLYYCGDRSKQSDICIHICLTQDIDTFFAFMGFTQPFRFTFTSYEEFFDFVLSSHFDIGGFLASRYDFDENELPRKSRNFKNGRECFTQFVKYVKSRQIHNTREYRQISPLDVVHAFGKQQEYHDIIKRQEQNEMYKKKISGERFKKITGLEGIPLGMFIKKFVEKYGREFITSCTDTEIEEFIKSEFFI